LKEKALKADLRVEDRSPQKLIKKNEVRPISSQPKKKTTRFPEFTRTIILAMKAFMREMSRLTWGSYLK
jgi:hypothetical protein